MIKLDGKAAGSIDLGDDIFGLEDPWDACDTDWPDYDIRDQVFDHVFDDEAEIEACHMDDPDRAPAVVTEPNPSNVTVHPNSPGKGGGGPTPDLQPTTWSRT